MAARRSRSRGLVRRWSAVRGWTSAPGRTSLTKAAESPTLAAYSRGMRLPSQGLPGRSWTPTGPALRLQATTQLIQPRKRGSESELHCALHPEPRLLLSGTVGPTQQTPNGHS